ncbi:4-alpha-glucanotransferase [Monocercomonoides exilis]|uniref:4-alpha-glucanotransferase n=1 Tax=Monocercomonoides exilis TaxID=2049356 RepID=UPI00355A4849|nr:4-alpha-glucanotransferase [Monocercomonoides exilis]|eukprot:MONOS_14331.1-p1 / transcript=MONOS_14331.1 / gene=MONOS_14331 / organism=Monocercomonoides_exilis_PA203 / gene_product=4-alpha-glucanotransferase / transcript_product=4-alpha-glucanotransferase / location=Mono_scaffold00982:4036-11585(+) / protein_length=2315 / sequence_SO=supercontig / SO=protein_coding / is_pseudo=false
MPLVVQTLTLNAEGYIQHNALVRVDAGSLLRIVVHRGTSAALLPFYVNYPDEDCGEIFERTKFRNILPRAPTPAEDGMGFGIYYEIKCQSAGAYQYYFEKESGKPAELQPNGRFVVEPLFDIRGISTPASGLAIHTVFAPCLGKVETWLPLEPPEKIGEDGALRVDKCALQPVIEAGYNMIHFAPICTLGISKSAYCIRNQLDIEPSVFGEDSSEKRFERLNHVVTRLRNEFGILSMVDVIWNHTSLDSPWVREHPEATYNLLNSPHLNLAFEVDRALNVISLAIALQNCEVVNQMVPPRLNADGVPAKDVIVHAALPPKLLTEQKHLDAVRNFVKDELRHFRLWEYNVIDVEDAVAAFTTGLPEQWRGGENPIPAPEKIDEDVRRECIVYDSAKAARWSRKVNTSKAIRYFMQFRASRQELISTFEASLHRINMPYFDQYDEDINKIVDNSMNLIAYERLDPNGPLRGEITARAPMVYPYFSHIHTVDAASSSKTSSSATSNRVKGDYLQYLHKFALDRPHLRKVEERMAEEAEEAEDSENELKEKEEEKEEDEEYSLEYVIQCRNDPTSVPLPNLLRVLYSGLPAVCNGWVFGRDPTEDFASPQSRAYVRREVVIWGDNFKLRYGNSPADSPFLWEHMRKYTEWCARIFDGLRLDNAHSTPLCVSEYLMDAARRVNKNLFTFAELFTPSTDIDVEYCSRLGVNALLKEASHNGDARSLGDMIYAMGGTAVGSLRRGSNELFALKARGLNAALSDITHDNNMPFKNRGAYYTLPLAAAVSAAVCPTLTTKGFDEIYPDKVLTNSMELYAIPKEEGNKESASQSASSTSPSRPISEAPFWSRMGILRARSVLARLHWMLAARGFSEIYVNVDGSQGIISIVRSHPKTHRAYSFIIRPAFRPEDALLPKPAVSLDDLAKSSSQAKKNEGGNKAAHSIAELYPYAPSKTHPELLPFGEAQPVLPFHSEVSGVVRRIVMLSYLAAAEPVQLLQMKQEDPENLTLGLADESEKKRREDEEEMNMQQKEKGYAKEDVAAQELQMKQRMLKRQQSQSVFSTLQSSASDVSTETKSGSLNLKPSPNEMRTQKTEKEHTSSTSSSSSSTKSSTSSQCTSKVCGSSSERKHRGVKSHLVLIESSGKGKAQRARDLYRAGITLERGGVKEEWNEEKLVELEKAEKDGKLEDEDEKEDTIDPQANTHLHFMHFPPGAVCVIATDIPRVARKALALLQPNVHSHLHDTERMRSSGEIKDQGKGSLLPQSSLSVMETLKPIDEANSLEPKGILDPVPVCECEEDRDSSSASSYASTCEQYDGCFTLSSLREAFKPLTPLDIYWLLFSCDVEERETTSGKRGAYSIDKVGALPYCGIGGLAPLLEKIAEENDLGHPLLDNLRRGNWLLDYILQRISEEETQVLEARWAAASNRSFAKDDEEGEGSDSKHNSEVAPVVIIPGNYKTRKERFAPLVELLSLKFDLIKAQIPRYLVPRYVDEVIRPLFRFAVSWLVQMTMPALPQSLVTSQFARFLCLSSAEMVAALPHTPLLKASRQRVTFSDAASVVQEMLMIKKRMPELEGRTDLLSIVAKSPSVAAQLASFQTFPVNISPSFSAGLPHFAQGFMRNWGRDTFIALRGLLLVTGRITEATYIIRAYGSVMRHGLIPNLMGEGEKPRYNARDAVWWWAQAIQDLCGFLWDAKSGYFPVVRKVPGSKTKVRVFEWWKKKDEEKADKKREWNDEECTRIVDLAEFDAIRAILTAPFPRRFDGADLPFLTSAEAARSLHVGSLQVQYLNNSAVSHGVVSRSGEDVSLLSLLQETLAAHAGGIHFREWDAGSAIDSKMKNEGFFVDSVLHCRSGLILGGNKLNCGTWCDKMGDSAQAGNLGIPATPRDGCPVEIAGLLKSTLRFVHSLSQLRINGEDGVIATDYEHISRKPAAAGTSVPYGDKPYYFMSTRNYAVPDPKEYSFDYVYMSYAAWEKRLRENFDRYYYVPTEEESEMITAGQGLEEIDGVITDNNSNFKKASSNSSASSSSSSSSAIIECSVSDLFIVSEAEVARRGIYKDVVGCHQHSWDYQLRPNVCIAMVVAPELFSGMRLLRKEISKKKGTIKEKSEEKLEEEEDNKEGPLSLQYGLCGECNREELNEACCDELNQQGKYANIRIRSPLSRRRHCLNALDTICEVLKTEGSLGIATLDPADWQYRPCYDQTDTQDYHTSCGFSYHQGPEWVWPAGYFMRALISHRHVPRSVRLTMNEKLQGNVALEEAIHRVGFLSLRSESKKNTWLSLPELTNANGAFCYGSSAAQAWSASCVLDALFDLVSLKQDPATE